MITGRSSRDGWLPSELPGWFAGRGFETKWDEELPALARTLLPPRFAAMVNVGGQRIAELRRAGVTGR